MGFGIEHRLGVDLVGDDLQIVGHGEVDDVADGVRLIDDADGVVGGGEQHGTDAPALRRHPFIGSLEGVSVQRLVAGHVHGDDAGALVDVVHEAGVVGRGDEEHIARLGLQHGLHLLVDPQGSEGVDSHQRHVVGGL